MKALELTRNQVLSMNKLSSWLDGCTEPRNVSGAILFPACSGQTHCPPALIYRFTRFLAQRAMNHTSAPVNLELSRTLKAALASSSSCS